MSREHPEETIEELKPGDAGVRQTVGKMIEFGLEDSTDEFVIRAAKKLKGKTDIETVKNVFDFVWKTFPYEKDPEGKEYVTAPILLLKMQYEYCDCDDMTTLLIALLAALKYEVAVKVISWDRARCEGAWCPFTHVYLMCYLPDENGWIALDPVQKASGFGIERPPQPIIRHQYYKVN